MKEDGGVHFLTYLEAVLGAEVREARHVFLADAVADLCLPAGRRREKEIKYQVRGVYLAS